MRKHAFRDWDGTDNNSLPFWHDVNRKIYYTMRPKGIPLPNWSFETIQKELRASTEELYLCARRFVNINTIKEGLLKGLINLFPDTEESIDLLAQHGVTQYLVSDGVADFGEIYATHFETLFAKYAKVLFEADKANHPERTLALLPELSKEDLLYVIGDAPADEYLAAKIGAIYVPVSDEPGSRLRAAQFIINHNL